MAEETNISWADATFNPVIGCTRLSPACDSCYAAAMMDDRYGRAKWGGPGKGNGSRVRTSESNWKQPLAWNRKAEKLGTRPFVFCASLADVFDNAWNPEWRRDLFELIHSTPNLIWLLLTKRPQNIVKMARAVAVADPIGRDWPKNAAIGATVEDQKRADQNVPAIVEAKELLGPAFAFLSCEPLLEQIYIAKWLPFGSVNGASPREQPAIDWVIAGGETDQGGASSRPSNPAWFRSLRDQCENAGVPFHLKQNGEWAAYDQIGASGWAFSGHSLKDGTRQGFLTSGCYGEEKPMFGGRSFETRYPWPGTHENPCMVKVGKKIAGRLLDGCEHNNRPQV